MAKTSKLTLQHMMKTDKQFDVTKAVKIDNHVILIKEKFRDTDIQEMVEDLETQLKNLAERKIKFDIFGFFALYVIKYFSDLEVPESVEEQTKMLKLMIDNGYLAPIWKSFDESQIQKVNDYMAVYKESRTQFVNNRLAEYEEAQRIAKEEVDQILAEAKAEEEAEKESQTKEGE